LLRRNSDHIGSSFKTSGQAFKTVFGGMGAVLNAIGKGFNSLGHNVGVVFSAFRSNGAGIKDTINALRMIYNVNGMRGIVNTFNLQSLTRGLRDFGTNIRESCDDARLGLMYMGDGLNAILGSLKIVGAAFVVAFAVIAVNAISKAISLTKDFLVEGFKYNAMMEQYIVSFEVFIGDQERALQLMKELKTYADWSSFTTPQVVEGAQQLLNYGVKDKDVMHVTRMLGDTSAGNADKFNRQAYAFGQVFANGRLNGPDNRQFVNAGFNPLQELSIMTGKSMAVLRKNMEDGEISVDMVVKAFEHATQKGGRFYDMQKKQSQTGIGLKSTVVDKATMFTGEATKKMYEALKPLLHDIIKILDIFLNNVDKIGASIQKNITPALEGVFTQFLNILGLNSDQQTSMDGITETIDQWTAGIGAFIKVLAVVINVVIIITTAFIDGLLLIGIALNSLLLGFKFLGYTTIAVFKGIFYALRLIIQNVVLGIVGAFEWAFKKVTNLFIKIWNMIADKTGMDKINVWDKVSEKNWSWSTLEDLNNADIKSVEGIKENMLDGWNETGDTWFKNMEKLVPAFDATTSVLKRAMGNIFGDTGGVDEFLAGLNKLKKNKPKDDNQEGIDTMNSTKDDTDKTADAMKKLAEEIKKAKEELYKFGDAFDKVTYERFSPNKLLNRTKKFFQQIAKFAVNLQKLENLGVSAEVINGIRGMGKEGYGIAAGLVKATPNQRKGILNNLTAIDLVAEQQAVKKVIFEHRGEIKITGKTTKGELVTISKTIANQIGKDQNRYNKTTSDIFKD
jgi:tape measure domain-containing protein